jgi:hypothetical protein
MAAMDQQTLEVLATMDEPAMVRGRFDEHNLGWAYAITWMFAIASCVLLTYSAVNARNRIPHFGVAIADAALTLFVLASMSELRLARAREGRWTPHVYARALGRHLPAWLIALYLVKFATLVYFAASDRGGWVAWGVLFPFAAIGLRLLLGQRLTLHGAMLLVIAIAGYLSPVTKTGVRGLGVYIPIVVLNGFVFAVGAWTSRNMKRATITEGVQRRTDARERLRIRDELRFAREVQISMLPEAPPQLGWADVAGVSLPATEVGGDYYDYFIVDGRLAVVCGDVAGHGLASGIALSALRSGFTLLRDSLLDPAHVLERLQEVVTQSARRRMMVTISVLLLDHDAQRATIASAGHPPLLIVRGATRAVETIELFAPPLGTRLGAPIPQRVVPFESGDVFILHSDGIYETLDAAGEQYGIDRLARIAASINGTAEEIKAAVLADVSHFRGDEPQDDDVTLVVVRIA